MSYTFGQLRKSQINSFLTSLTYELNDVQKESDLSQTTIFVDKGIDLQTDNILHGTTDTGKKRSYYLRFKIFKQELPQLINVKLINTNKINNNTQKIKTIEIEAGSGFTVFEMVVTPNDNYIYDRILFELERGNIDYTIDNEDGTFGRKISMSVERLDEIYNVINYLNPFINNTGILKQIGVQGDPGLIMSIDGEEIRIGRSGLYEIRSGIEVTFIGFIIEDNEKYFVLDYQY